MTGSVYFHEESLVATGSPYWPLFPQEERPAPEPMQLVSQVAATLSMGTMGQVLSNHFRPVVPGELSYAHTVLRRSGKAAIPFIFVTGVVALVAGGIAAFTNASDGEFSDFLVMAAGGALGGFLAGGLGRAYGSILLQRFGRRLGVGLEMKALDVLVTAAAGHLSMTVGNSAASLVKGTDRAWENLRHGLLTAEGWGWGTMEMGAFHYGKGYASRLLGHRANIGLTWFVGTFVSLLGVEIVRSISNRLFNDQSFTVSGVLQGALTRTYQLSLFDLGTGAFNAAAHKGSGIMRSRRLRRAPYIRGETRVGSDAARMALATALAASFPAIANGDVHRQLPLFAAGDHSSLVRGAESDHGTPWKGPTEQPVRRMPLRGRPRPQWTRVRRLWRTEQLQEATRLLIEAQEGRLKREDLLEVCLTDHELGNALAFVIARDKAHWPIAAEWFARLSRQELFGKDGQQLGLEDSASEAWFFRLGTEMLSRSSQEVRSLGAEAGRLVRQEAERGSARIDARDVAKWGRIYGELATTLRTQRDIFDYFFSGFDAEFTPDLYPALTTSLEVIEQVRPPLHSASLMGVDVVRFVGQTGRFAAASSRWAGREAVQEDWKPDEIQAVKAKGGFLERELAELLTEWATGRIPERGSRALDELIEMVRHSAAACNAVEEVFHSDRTSFELTEGQIQGLLAASRDFVGGEEAVIRILDKSPRALATMAVVAASDPEGMRILTRMVSRGGDLRIGSTLAAREVLPPLVKRFAKHLSALGLKDLEQARLRVVVKRSWRITAIKKIRDRVIAIQRRTDITGRERLRAIIDDLNLFCRERCEKIEAFMGELGSAERDRFGDSLADNRNVAFTLQRVWIEIHRLAAVAEYISLMRERGRDGRGAIMIEAGTSVEEFVYWGARLQELLYFVEDERPDLFPRPGEVQVAAAR